MNFTTNEGEALILKCFYEDYAEPTEFWLGCAYFASPPAENITLANMVDYEISGNGYERKPITRDTASTGFSAPALNGGHMQIVMNTAAVQTAAGGAMPTFNYIFIATSSDDSGTLMHVIPTSVARTLSSGDSDQLTAAISLS
jgi:hypothetical protein